ncbi:MAG: YbaN family protein [Jhaorihella sp.]
MKFVWAGLGLICVGLAVVGAFLPLLPTVPFLLLASFFFARSSERLHHWILTHRTFGPVIEDWNRSGAIRPIAKRLATVSVVAVFALTLILGVSKIIVIIQGVVLTAVLAFIWSRPNG